MFLSVVLVLDSHQRQPVCIPVALPNRTNSLPRVAAVEVGLASREDDGYDGGDGGDHYCKLVQ